MTKGMKCTSCGAPLDAESVKSEFPCPSCSAVRIGRCNRCKKHSREYTCPSCGFIGP